MQSKVRNLIYEPLVERTLNQIVPDFTMELPNGSITAPALLSVRDGKFLFSIHFVDGFPPALLTQQKKTSYTQDDTFAVRGQIGGEVAFVCDGVFPSFNTTVRSRGTSTLHLDAKRMHLTAEGTDMMLDSEVSELLAKKASSKARNKKYRAHSIFHGPELRMMNGTSETVETNDFLGEASSRTLDTHLLSGSGYEGALIQKGQELHMHIRTVEGHDWNRESWKRLIKSLEQAIGFTHGFQPWPVYCELRSDGKVDERWLACHQALDQTSLSPISRSLWAQSIGNKSDPIHQIIPTIASGLLVLNDDQRKGISNLLWQFRAMELSDLPHTTKLLMVCSILDGAMKVIAGMSDPEKKPKTDKTWMSACAIACLSWEKWGNPLFELYGKYRHELAHGWLWHANYEKPTDYFNDYPKLCGGLNTLIAAACGYDGAIMSDIYKSQATIIAKIREEAT